MPQYQTPGSGNAPGSGGGNTPKAPSTPTSPGSGAGPGNAGAGPGATTRTLPAGRLPLTGFEDGVFLAMLGFVLLLAGATMRRGLRQPSRLA